MSEITYLPSTMGGILIGLSAVCLMFTVGRIAGISGIVSRLLPPWAGDGQTLARVAFVAGLIAGPLLATVIAPSLGFAVAQPAASPAGPALLLGAGVLVGFGSVFGGGCTSGHGVCGLARVSPRSIAATVLFLSAALATVFVARHVLGG